MSLDFATVSSFVAAAFGGGGLLKLIQIILAHRQAIDGDFGKRDQAARANFQLVVEHLEKRIEHLEASEADCEKRNRELEQKVRILEARIEELMLRSPWRHIADP